jgi:hypothetical protein
VGRRKAPRKRAGPRSADRAPSCLGREGRRQFREWARHRKVQEKVYQWRKGDWDVPYQREAEAVEQAFRIVDLCAKSFQRAARQLANIRLIRAKTARTRRRERAKLIKGVRVA